MSEHDGEQGLTAAVALEQWRAAERTAAVARRGRLAGEVAAAAAAEAAEAALATADAARSALQAMALAETSAAKTAVAAKLAVQAALADSADALTESALADIGEGQAQLRYQEAAARAGRRSKELTPG